MEASAKGGMAPLLWWGRVVRERERARLYGPGELDFAGGRGGRFGRTEETRGVAFERQVHLF